MEVGKEALTCCMFQRSLGVHAAAGWGEQSRQKSKGNDETRRDVLVLKCATACLQGLLSTAEIKYVFRWSFQLLDVYMLQGGGAS